VDTTQKIKAATATLMVGFLLAIAFAATAQAANGAPRGMTAQERQAVLARADATNRYYRLGAYRSDAGATQQAEERRSEAMNRFYHLGAYSSASAAAQRAVERRSQAINRFYRVGSYAVISTSSPFDWSDAGIGAGGMLGLIILAGGLTVLARRRTTGEPSSPSTT
jgi:hypothetical protein